MIKGDPRIHLVLCLKCNMPLCETCYRCHYCLGALCSLKWLSLLYDIAYFEKQGIRVDNKWRQMTQEEQNSPLPANVELIQ